MISYAIVGSDGPNVNKTVWNKLNQNIQELDKPGSVDIGLCNLHVPHNMAFTKVWSPMDLL